MENSGNKLQLKLKKHGNRKVSTQKDACMFTAHVVYSIQKHVLIAALSYVVATL